MSNSLYLLRLPKIQDTLETLDTISSDDLGTLQKITSDGRFSARLHTFPKIFFDDDKKTSTYFYDLEHTFRELNIFYMPIKTFRDMENPFFIEVSTEDYSPYFMGDVSIERVSYDGRRCEDDLLSNCYDLTRADSYIYHKILLHGKADDGIGGLGSYAYQIGCILAQCNRFDDDDVEDLGAVKNIKHYDEFKMVPTFLGPWAILAFCGDRLEAISCLPNDDGRQNRFIESWKERLGFYKYFEMGLLGEALNQLTDKNSPIPVEIRKQIFASQLRGSKLFERYLTCDDKEKREMLLDIGSALGPTKDMKYLINTYKVDEINLKDCGFIKDIFKNPAGTVDFCPNPDRILS